MKNTFYSLSACCLAVLLTVSLTNTKLAAQTAKTPAMQEATKQATPVTEKVNETPTTTIEFAEMEHDFGIINQGDKVEHVFTFTNTGNEPLVITSAKGSCGCTIPEWPKEPVLPGETGEMKVVFNSHGKRNKQTKTVTIVANTDPNPTRLTIKAEVLVSATDAAAPSTPTKKMPAIPSDSH